MSLPNTDLVACTAVSDLKLASLYQEVNILHILLYMPQVDGKIIVQVLGRK